MWKVILHFGRGHVQTYEFEKAADAENCMSIAVFRNRDCVNAQVYYDEFAKPIELPKSLIQTQEMFDRLEELKARMG